MDDDDYEIRIAALACIGAVGSVASQSLVRGSLKDSEPLVRITAVEALVELGHPDEQTIYSIQALLADERESVRAYAGWALGRIADSNVAHTMAAHLPNESSDVAKAGILEGLYKITNNEYYLNDLKHLVRSIDPEARAFASNSLVGVASRANVSALIRCLVDAVSSEVSPAIRSVMDGNLRTLREMDESNDFELE